MSDTKQHQLALKNRYKWFIENLENRESFHVVVEDETKIEPLYRDVLAAMIEADIHRTALITDYGAEKGSFYAPHSPAGNQIGVYGGISIESIQEALLFRNWSIVICGNVSDDIQVVLDELRKKGGGIVSIVAGAWLPSKDKYHYERAELYCYPHIGNLAELSNRDPQLSFSQRKPAHTAV